MKAVELAPKYNLLEPWKTLDDWQKEYIAEVGNCFLLCGRQSGKTAAASIKIGTCAANEKSGGDYLVIALTEKQAYQLFHKTLMFLEAKFPHMIVRRGNKKPTKHEINLTNGIIIRCYAAGIDGAGLRTFTIKKMFIDEAAPMAREVFTSVTPMLSVTKGTLDIMSTPRGKEGYFYECSKKDTFTKFYVNAEDCPRHTKEFLDDEKENMSALEYAQEYRAEFLDELRQFFPDKLIKECMQLKRRETISPGKRYYLGVDIARMGKDETTFEIVDATDRENMEHIENLILKKQLLTQTAKQIIQLNRNYNFKQIFIDDGGMGVGVLDMLLDNDDTKRKVVAINNTSRPLTRDEKEKKKLIKEDIFNNLLSLMERNKIKLLKDEDLFLSLKSVNVDI